ncbi:MAG: 4a-hydroxytetrahydrobiopterin dehydratase [Pseudomonadota bacterium]
MLSSKELSVRTLSERKCEPCEGGVDPLDEHQSHELLAALHDDWQLNVHKTEIAREVHFAGYHRTVSFVNAVAWIANTEGHHPLLSFGYGKCTVIWTTNAINGLSVNDFICAAKTDLLLDAI